MKEKDLLYLVVSSFILTILWVGFNIYDSIATSTITEVLKVQIAPISPEFDPATIEKIRAREIIAPAYTFTATGIKETPTPTQAPIVELPTPSPSPLFVSPTTAILQSPTPTP